MMRKYASRAGKQLSGYAAAVTMVMICLGMSALYLHQGQRIPPGATVGVSPVRGIVLPASVHLPVGQSSVQELVQPSVTPPVEHAAPGLPLDHPTPNGPQALLWQNGATRYRAVQHISVWNATVGEWQAASPDLTEVNQPQSPGFGIDGITAADITQGNWYVGTLVGHVEVRDSHNHWASVADILPERTVSAIATDPNVPTGRIAAVAYDGYGSATPASPGHVYLTQDGGVTWSDVSGNLPDAPVTALTYGTSHGHSELLATVDHHRYAMTTLETWETTPSQ
jgi:hypothetical protein